MTMDCIAQVMTDFEHKGLFGMAKHRRTYALLMVVMLPVVMLIGTLLTNRYASAATPAPTSGRNPLFKLAYQATDGDLSHIYVANADASNPVMVSGMSVN